MRNHSSLYSESEKPQVSVVVLTYHPQWSALKQTLYSIFTQKNINFEVVIADDGSPDPLREEIETYARSFGFGNLVFAGEHPNQGTVRNFLAGVKASNGIYVKPISPGDFLADENTLSDWYQAVSKKGAAASFGQAIYYSLENDTISAYPGLRSPWHVELFEGDYPYLEQKEKITVSILAVNDTILGASVIYERKILEELLERMEGKVIYAEDVALRLLTARGQLPYYYPHPVVFYEYGQGISTAKAKAWAEKIRQDMEAGDQILLEFEPGSKNAGKYQDFVRKALPEGKKRKLIKAAAFPSMIGLRKSMNSDSTPAPLDEKTEERLREILNTQPGH